MPNVGPVEILVTTVAFIAVMLAIVLVCYAVIVSVARVLHRTMPATTPPRDPALDALRTRLANGEIDEAEFQRLRSILQSL
jgi:uncharacterized membrane protein